MMKSRYCGGTNSALTGAVNAPMTVAENESPSRGFPVRIPYGSRRRNVKRECHAWSGLLLLRLHRRQIAPELLQIVRLPPAIDALIVSDDIGSIVSGRAGGVAEGPISNARNLAKFLDGRRSGMVE